jgi:hypothetical protein
MNGEIVKTSDYFVATTLCVIQTERSVNADKKRPKFHYTKPTESINFLYYNIRLFIPTDIKCDIIKTSV